MPLAPHLMARIVAEALQEDIGPGDLTTWATVPESLLCRGVISARSPLVVAGVGAAIESFRQLDREARILRAMKDGDEAGTGSVLVELEGRARALLTAERVALNLMGRLCGIATLTRRFVEAAAGTTVQIADTRKTTPGLRALEKDAVAAGGGANHRIGLWDAVLIKDNHVDLAGGTARAVARAREKLGGKFPVEVEVRDLAELGEAITAGADMVLLDNFSDQDLERAVNTARGKAKIEVSGGITLDRIERIARLGVDRISIGALTHSAGSADLSMRITPWKE